MNTVMNTITVHDVIDLRMMSRVTSADPISAPRPCPYSTIDPGSRGLLCKIAFVLKSSQSHLIGVKLQSIKEQFEDFWIIKR